MTYETKTIKVYEDNYELENTHSNIWVLELNHNKPFVSTDIKMFKKQGFRFIGVMGNKRNLMLSFEKEV